LPIDIRILGVEYQDKDFTGKKICEHRNIDLYYNKRDHSFSSSDLRRRVYQAEFFKNATDQIDFDLDPENVV
jgi:glycerol-3-phosphate cytidylyltransferase